MKRFAKLLLIIFLLIILSIFGIMAFIKFAPQFGQAPTGSHLEQIKKSPNYDKENDIFENLITTTLDMNMSKLGETLSEFLFSKNTKPPVPLPSAYENLDLRDSVPHITWFGHSAILLEIDGHRILIDPMLGPSASPVSFFGRRFENQSEIPLDMLDNIDAILISHDHYDHLDYPSIQKLKSVTKKFYVPLGVGSHLERWGVDADAIEELDWWDATTLESLQLVFAPSRHFSGRATSDRNKTLWGSWVIQGKSNKIFFSGDSGYGPHFEEIGNKYGPFDFAMMECGQYNQKWKDIHMLPEETVQATLDVQAKRMMPIHWGAFQLAVHTWDDPVIRASIFAGKKDLDVATPIIGNRISIHENTSQWWQELK